MLPIIGEALGLRDDNRKQVVLNNHYERIKLSVPFFEIEQLKKKSEY